MFVSSVVKILNTSSSDIPCFKPRLEAGPLLCVGPIFGPFLCRRKNEKDKAPHVASSIAHNTPGFPSKLTTSSICNTTTLVIMINAPCATPPSQYPRDRYDKSRPSYRQTSLASSTL